MAFVSLGRYIDPVSTDEHLSALLQRPAPERARAARALLESLDDDGDHPDAAEAQEAELLRRIERLDAGDAELVSASEARERVLARLRQIRGE